MPSMNADEIKRAYGKDRMLLLAEQLGLKRKGTKCQCPARCGERPDCSVSEKNGTALFHCHRTSCGAAGSVIDMVMHTNRLSDAEAMTWLSENDGKFPDPPKVKRTPFNAAAAWEQLPVDHQVGADYLRGRGLEGAIAAGLVRFNGGRTPRQKWLNEQSVAGFVVAVRMYGVDGAISHLQMRSVFPPRDKEDTKKSTPGGYGSGVAMGDVASAKTAARVYLAEGIADTLALQLAGVVAIGAPGDSSLKNLPRFLGDVAGRQFVLCLQNDPKKQSEIGFEPAKRTIQTAGGVVFIMRPPTGTKDPADWLKAIGLEEFRRIISTALPVAPDDSAPAPSIASDNVIQLAPPASTEDLAWDKARATTKVKYFGNSYASLCLILRNDRRVLEERPIWNEMLCSPVVKGRLLEDHDTGRIRETIELNLVDDDGDAIEPSAGDVEKAVVQIAHERCVHPVRDYLNGLKWDGKPRIEGIAEDILNIERTELTQKLIRYWFIGAAKRPLNPGCKMDSVLVLQGPQYKGKSTFFSTLAGPPEWFSDDKIDIENRDSLMLMQSVWIVEWAELATMKRAKDVEALKQFISSKTNKFRLPYGRTIVERPRHSVIVGTTNPTRFLNDPTGNRRFWPIQIGSALDIAKLAEWRDQLWAEAVVAVRAGERYWLDEAEDQALSNLQRPHEETHPWLELVGPWLETNAKSPAPWLCTTANVLHHGIGKMPGQWTTSDEMTVASIMRQLDWEKDRTDRARTDDGKRVRVWKKKTDAAANEEAS